MRALFNGCSFVWGDELMDPMNSRFSKLFAEHTGMEEVNLAIRGASNDRIYRTTMDYLQLEGSPDYMIIVWSGIDRFEYVDVKEKDKFDPLFMQMSASRLDNSEFLRKRRSLQEYMVHIQNNYKRSIDTINKMCEIQRLCEVQNIPLLQYQFAFRHNETVRAILSTKGSTPREEAFIKYYKSKLDYLKPYSLYGLMDDDHDLLTVSMNLNDVEITKDGYGHPLEKSQVAFKEMMLSALEEHYDIRFQ